MYEREIEVDERKFVVWFGDEKVEVWASGVAQAIILAQAKRIKKYQDYTVTNVVEKQR